MSVTTPTAFWTLGEATGENRLDSIGSLHLTPQNGPTQQFAHKGYACHFARASSQYLEIADNATLPGSDRDFCFMVVVNADALQGAGGFNLIFSKDNGSEYEYELFYSGTAARFRWAVINGGSSAAVSANNLGAPSAGTRYLIIVWHDSVNNEIGIQVNNGTPDTASYSAGAANTAHPFRIGAEGGGFYWDGTIGHVAFWDNYVLTSGERTALWANGTLLRLAEFSAGAASPETIYAHNGTSAQGYEAWPSVAPLSNTTQYCALTDGAAHVADDQRVLGFTRSGGSWSSGSPVTIHSTVGKASSGPLGTVFRDALDGSLKSVCVVWDNTTFAFSSAPVKRSTDNGANWSSWGTVAVPSGYDWINPYGQWSRVGSNLYLPAYAQVTATGFWNSLLMVSADDGVTWAVHGVIGTGDATNKFSETDVVHLSGNDWFAFMRDDNGGGRLFLNNSSNGGSTWNTPTTFASGGVEGSTGPALYKVSDTKLFMFYGKRAGSPYAITQWETPADPAVTYGPSYWSTPQDAGISVADFGYPSPFGDNGELKFAYYAPGTSGADVLMDSTGIAVPLQFATTKRFFLV